MRGEQVKEGYASSHCTKARFKAGGGGEANIW